MNEAQATVPEMHVGDEGATNASGECYIPCHRYVVAKGDQLPPSVRFAWRLFQVVYWELGQIITLNIMYPIAVRNRTRVSVCRHPPIFCTSVWFPSVLDCIIAIMINGRYVYLHFLYLLGTNDVFISVHPWSSTTNTSIFPKLRKNQCKLCLS
jgi:hypothetical protein